MAGMVKITLKKSAIDRPARQKATLKALGLNRINQSVSHNHTPQIEGMVKVVAHLVEVENN
jgi:large subunit ribosomal protein L30